MNLFLEGFIKSLMSQQKKKKKILKPSSIQVALS